MMSFKGLAYCLRTAEDETLTIAEMTARLNNGSVAYKPPGYSPTGYIQGDAPSSIGHYYTIDRENEFQYRDYFCYGTPILEISSRADKITRIGKSAFEGCTKLHQVGLYLPTGYEGSAVLREIDDRAFFGAGSEHTFDLTYLLTNLAPSMLERIGVSAFENSGCAGNLHYHMWLGSVARIESRAFANSFLTVVGMGEVSDYIAPNIFTGCTALKEVILDFSQSSSSATNYPWGADTNITKFTWGD